MKQINMFENFKKEWKIYKFIKQNWLRLEHDDFYSSTWWIRKDGIVISDYSNNDYGKDNGIAINGLFMNSTIIRLLLRRLIQNKKEYNKIKSAKREERHRLQVKDKFIQEHNIK